MENRKDVLKYIRSFVQPDTEELLGLEKASEGRNDIQPPVERETGRFLSLLIRLTGARLVLELGSGNGYSGLWLAGALAETGGKLITIDGKERLHHEAASNYRQAGYGEVVEPLFGDIPLVLSESILPAYSGRFDMIFQDSGKSLYPQLLETTYELLKPGGLLVADDTLFKVNPTVRSNLGRFTHEYNEKVFMRSDLYSALLPVGHGLTISMKRKEE